MVRVAVLGVKIPLPTVSVPAFTCTTPLLVRLKLPATALLPVLIKVPALVMVSAWQQPFQFRSVIPPSVSVPPASVLSVAAPPWERRVGSEGSGTRPPTHY